MKQPIEELLEPCLSSWGFLPASHKETLNMEGRYYEISPELGEGYYWYYQREGMFAIAVMDLRLWADTVVEQQQSEFISITYYDAVSAEELNPYKRRNAHCIRGHVFNRNVYRIRYHKSVPIRGVELMLVPGYYHEYLEQKFPQGLPNIETAFLSVDGISDFPELVLLMRQIQTFQGTGISAHLFYESKVAEAVSLIMDKTKQTQNSIQKTELSPDDLQNLDAVRLYIEDHFAFHIQADQLTRIACMGQTKLRYSFKAVYGYTITEYIQNKRIAHAEYLLIETDFPIKIISQAVGYNHAGRFSNLFQKSTGLLPDEYRHLIQNKL